MILVVLYLAMTTADDISASIHVNASFLTIKLTGSDSMDKNFRCSGLEVVTLANWPTCNFRTLLLQKRTSPFSQNEFHKRSHLEMNICQILSCKKSLNVHTEPYSRRNDAKQTVTQICPRDEISMILEPKSSRVRKCHKKSELISNRAPSDIF